MGIIDPPREEVPHTVTHKSVFFGVVFAGSLGIARASGEDIVVPLLATQILWINLVTDAAPALAMGWTRKSRM